MPSESYSVVIVGTGFASSFFLLQYLRRASATDRILVLERGKRYSPTWKIKNRSNTEVIFDDIFVNRTPDKPWIQNIAFGGGACWWGNTPRFHPNDFKTKTLYNVGVDWPLSYEDLEKYYLQAEETMGIAGGAPGPYPRSKPYPSPPHAFNAFDKLIARKYPGLHIPLPSARSSTPATNRPPCCGNGVCSTCPIMSKFQVDLHLAHLYQDPRVTLLCEAPVERLDIAGDRVTGVFYTHNGKEERAACDLAVVGAHAIMTPYLLLRSGLTDRALGRYLNEQISINVQLDLDGIDNYDGGQAVTGLGLMFLDGAFRKEQPGALLENWNLPWLRAEAGRWRQRALIKFVLEDIPSFENRVTVSSEDPSKPEVHYADHSAYMKRGVREIKSLTERFIEGLPVEDFQVIPLEGLGGSAHIQGTCRMGTDPNDSVVDRDLRHHKVRNLVALGSGVFPTCPAGNPTLSLSALALWAADRL